MVEFISSNVENNPPLVVAIPLYERIEDIIYLEEK